MKIGLAPVSLPSGDPTMEFTRFHKIRLAIEILSVYARVRWLMARRELPDVVQTLRASADSRWVVGGERELQAGGGWRYALSVVKTLRLLPADSRCLMRSLVLLSVLARRGARTTLVIGVRADPRIRRSCLG